MQLYTPAMGGTVRARRIALTPNAIPGASYRFVSQGWGLIQVYFGELRDKTLKNSHTNHNSETRATTWAPTYADEQDRVDDWNWSEVERISGRFNRQIRKLAVSKHGSRPVLRQAHELVQRGEIQLG